MTRPLTRRQVLCAGALAFAAPPATRDPRGRLDDLLRRRRMVRRFRPDPVPAPLVERLLTAAARVPSAGDTQPWAFVVVRDAARRAQLGRAALNQMFVATAPVVIVVCAEQARSRARYHERGDRYALIDTAFASLLLLLAVVEHGLGACFVGAFDDAEVARVLGLPGDVLPVGIIPVGYPAESPRGRPRRPLRELVHRERW